MSAALFFAAALLSAPDAELVELTGKIRVTGQGQQPTVSLNTGSEELILKGDLTRELQAAVTFSVTVVGRQDGRAFQLKDYAIADIGGGVKPIIGTLIKSDEGAFALRDGTGDAMPLSLRASSKRRLSKMDGAKVWVHGKQLVSGAYAVKRYGILLRPEAPKEAAPGTTAKD